MSPQFKFDFDCDFALISLICSWGGRHPQALPEGLDFSMVSVNIDPDLLRFFGISYSRVLIFIGVGGGLNFCWGGGRYFRSFLGLFLIRWILFIVLCT